MAIEKKSLISKSVSTTKSKQKAAPATTTTPSPKLQTALMMAKRMNTSKAMLAKAMLAKKAF